MRRAGSEQTRPEHLAKVQIYRYEHKFILTDTTISKVESVAANSFLTTNIFSFRSVFIFGTRSVAANQAKGMNIKWKTNICCRGVSYSEEQVLRWLISHKSFRPSILDLGTFFNGCSCSSKTEQRILTVNILAFY